MTYKKYHDFNLMVGSKEQLVSVKFKSFVYTAPLQETRKIHKSLNRSSTVHPYKIATIYTQLYNRVAMCHVSTEH